MKNHKQHGFTIVELLIVIVVIGILVAIVTVAYNGIQERALNTARISATKQALQLLKSYNVVNDAYPTIPEGVATGTKGACIGTGWPTLQGQAVCWNVYTDGGAPGASTFFEVSSVNAELTKVGSLPTFPKKNVASGVDGSGRPLDLTALVLVERTATDNALFQQGYSLAYLLQGDTSCGIPGAVQSSLLDATRCIIYLGPSSG